jgi:tRNA(Ile)-lysidine synthase
MLQAFKAYIKRENLFVSGQKILLAVSGGIDSVAMAELFFRAKYPFAIAHANFSAQGRGFGKR